MQLSKSRLPLPVVVGLWLAAGSVFGQTNPVQTVSPAVAPVPRRPMVGSNVGVAPRPFSANAPRPISPSVPSPAVAKAAPAGPTLAFDAEVKEYSAQPGEKSAPFVFSLTNISPAEITITNATASCGCTVAKLPSTPWRIPAGGSGQIQVTVDLVGKFGTVTKTVTLNSSVGPRLLSCRIIIPTSSSSTQMSEAQRKSNATLAANDRQAVFRGECATCHVKPAIGKRGADLYAAACGICHETPRRATMVPDLHALKKPGSLEYWRNWISHGKTNSLMPAFAISEGGPLSDEQIASVAGMLNRIISRNFSTNKLKIRVK